MFIKYFSESAYLELFDNIKSNINKYKDIDYDWESEFKNSIKESRIDALLPKLDSNNSDFANAIIIYDALKDKITPKQACNPLLWTYLTHVEYWEYTVNRWGKKGLSEGGIKDRFFCGTQNGSRAGLLRNSIARLWWTGYLTYCETGNPYRLTRVLTSNSDLWVSIIERKFSMNKNIVVGILEAIVDFNDNYPQGINYIEWRELTKYINRYGGVSVLDFLHSEDIKEISYRFLVKMRNKQ